MICPHAVEVKSYRALHQRELISRCTWIIVPLLAALLATLRGLDLHMASFVLGALVGVSVWLALGIVSSLRERERFAQRVVAEPHRFRREITVEEGGISMVSEAGSQDFQWGDFERVHLFEHGVVLDAGPRGFVTLPGGALTPSMRQQILAKLPPGRM